MNGFLLFLPFLLIRFGVLALMNRAAINRAAHFAPMQDNEIWVYWVYQISNIALMAYLFFLTVRVDFSWTFYTGVIFYFVGLVLCTICMINFASPYPEGMNTSGLYSISRNPMYLSYYLIFTGCALLTQSWALGGIVGIFILTSHWIIRAEERWCIEKFGEKYKRYMRRVKRYLGFSDRRKNNSIS